MSTGIALGRLIRSKATPVARRLWAALQPATVTVTPPVALVGAPPESALDWLRLHESAGGGMRVSSALAEAYPEVTGYLVPTLLAYGERGLAQRLVRWLLCIQRGDGAYTSPYGDPYVFDSGQILRGLLAAAEYGIEGEDALAAARRVADWLLGQMVEGGRRGFGERYADERVHVPETVHLYVLPPLLEASRALDVPEYRDAALRCLDYYWGHPHLLDMNDLTHFLAYELEALIELGRQELAMPALEALRREQGADGAVRGMGGQPWVCAPGLAQLAVCWYMVGQREPADRAMDWLDAHQEPDGGFLGSYGEGASYLERVEIPWAAKFYLDAHRLRVAAMRRHESRALADGVPGKALPKAIISSLRAGSRLLAVGLDAGQMQENLRETVPDADLLVVDELADVAMATLARARVLPGRIEALPLPDDTYDLVVAGESWALAGNQRAAAAEMIRVARPSGSVVIIDGGRPVPTWAHRSGGMDVAGALQAGCEEVSREPIASGNSGPPMVAWSGRKRSALGGSEWNRVLVSAGLQESVTRRVRENHLLPWEQEIMLHTSPGEALLEVGSGTGEMSLALAQAGRRVSILDISPESVAFVQRCARRLGLEVSAVCADATQPLPFGDDAFDCVWSSGLLDRVDPRQRRAMIAEFARMSRDRVIVMVANAACVAYRAGMMAQQQSGTWPYGLETPLLSLRADFDMAGLCVDAEYSVGARHALEFLPAEHPMRPALERWMRGLSEEDLQKHHQGYLLVTVGRRAKGGEAC